MKFELGKCYRHPTGKEMKIVGLAQSTMYGHTLIAENAVRPLPPVFKSNDINQAFNTGCVQEEFSCVGMDEDNASNWEEMSEEDWMKNFS